MGMQRQVRVPVGLASAGVDLGVDHPGRTALTRMPSVATSRARPIVNVVGSAPFDAA